MCPIRCVILKNKDYLDLVRDQSIIVNIFVYFCLPDLQLAAQLGKVLLERNKDLEEQVRQAQVAQYEQAREIEVHVL